MRASILNALGAATIACLGFTAPASGASLGLNVDPAIGFALDGAVEVFDDGAALDILNGAGGTLASVGLPGLADNAFDLLATGDSLDTAAPVVDLFVDGLDGSLLGTMRDFAVDAGVLELLFEVTDDDFGLFGDRVLMVVTGDFSGGREAYDASIRINPVIAAVPLPAGLPLLLTALLAGAVVGRARAQS